MEREGKILTSNRTMSKSQVSIDCVVHQSKICKLLRLSVLFQKFQTPQKRGTQSSHEHQYTAILLKANFLDTFYSLVSFWI